ncbi:MAG: hypothetical protein AAFX93_17965 [Verrucomicrobiota bacterium]
MFLRASERVRPWICLVLALVVTIAGAWPILSQPVARSLDNFQRYSAIMPAVDAWQFALEGAEFCNGLPVLPDEPVPAELASSQSVEGHLVPVRISKTWLDRPVECPSLMTVEVSILEPRAYAPEPPPPRA